MKAHIVYCTSGSVMIPKRQETSIKNILATHGYVHLSMSGCVSVRHCVRAIAFFSTRHSQQTYRKINSDTMFRLYYIVHGMD